MSNVDTQQYAVFLRPDQWDNLLKLAQRKGLTNRQALIRWAIDDYLAEHFFSPSDSTYRSKSPCEQPVEQVT